MVVVEVVSASEDRPALVASVVTAAATRHVVAVAESVVWASGAVAAAFCTSSVAAFAISTGVAMKDSVGVARYMPRGPRAVSCINARCSSPRVPASKTVTSHVEAESPSIATAMVASLSLIVATRWTKRRRRPRSKLVAGSGIGSCMAPGPRSALVAGIRFVDASSAHAPKVATRAQMQPQLPDSGIAVIDKERVDKKAQMKEQFDKEKWWRVLLHNDEIHTFEYVTGCLTRTVKHLSRRKAYNITWEAHSSGMATVACVWKSLAEQFCVNLQQSGLTVSIAPDSQFSGNKGGTT
eukprot:TRINITY_DN56604_c0_g1_i1.p1 TRINITY_DN56604_c0_g1~~TRINITY_DN56604_c0_g1_i1.p1  ORF type:complete len:324 (+),score=38.63 TRINITY_DN56604_c0_g1_i1:90-974(+)